MSHCERQRPRRADVAKYHDGAGHMAALVVDRRGGVLYRYSTPSRRISTQFGGRTMVLSSRIADAVGLCTASRVVPSMMR